MMINCSLFATVRAEFCPWYGTNYPHHVLCISGLCNNCDILCLELAWGQLFDTTKQKCPHIPDRMNKNVMVTSPESTLLTESLIGMVAGAVVCLPLPPLSRSLMVGVVVFIPPPPQTVSVKIQWIYSKMYIWRTKFMIYPLGSQKLGLWQKKTCVRLTNSFPVWPIVGGYEGADGGMWHQFPWLMNVHSAG